MTTFDRYLLSRFLYVNAVFLIAVLGLFVVVDGFMNLDEFQVHAISRVTGKLDLQLLILRMANHYLYQSAAIFDLAGPSVVVLSSMTTLALMLRQGEIHPVLAAGIPTYRLTLTLLLGTLGINTLLILNQELVIPRIAHELVGNHGDSAKDAQGIKTQYDPMWRVFVSGEYSIPGERRIHKPELQLPAPTLAEEYVTLRAKEAIYYPPRKGDSGGWLLVEPDPPVSKIPLTAQGRKFLLSDPAGKNAFARLTVTFDQLCARNSSLRLVASPEIVRRLQQPVSSLMVRRASLVHLHARLTRPLLTIIGLYVVIPLICRKDRMGPMQQVANIATCMAVVSIVYGASIGSQFLGQNGLLSTELAVWAPLILGVGVAGWLTSVVRT